MMRIAQFTYEYPPQTTGGLGTYMECLVRYLRTAGDHVDLFHLGERPLDVPSVHLPAFAGDRVLTYSASELARRGAAQDYDVVVCQDWPGVIASQSIWKNSVPLVYTCHLPMTWDIGAYDDVPGPFNYQMEFSALAHAGLVIAVSGAVRDDLERRFPFTAGKTRVAYNGTDTTFFRPPDDPATRRPDTVLYVGRFYEQKGFDLVPEIFAGVHARHPRARFEIMGVGGLETVVRDRLHAAGLAHLVTWRPFGTLAEVRAAYQRSSVVIMPSRLEPFGLVATEAMATGTPLVAADTGGLAEIVDHGRTGFLAAPGDTAGTAELVAAVLDDPSLAQRMAVAAREAVVAEFAQDVTYGRIRQAYLDVHASTSNSSVVAARSGAGAQ
ncbi:glycosyltransferase family 4 protein [Micromonospora sp. RB23]